MPAPQPLQRRLPVYLLFLVLAVCLLPRLRRPVPSTYPVDFNVYYSTAMLVRHGRAADLYIGADTGTDPQKLVASPATPIYREAHAEGLSFVGLYVYPPILADLLVPLTALPLPQATRLWFGLNVAFLLLTGMCLLRLLRVRPWSFGALALLLGTFCYVPALQCLVDGQITVFLLLLWAAGLVLLQAGYVRSAAALFALATAIKLTPAIVLLPFLLWRHWRFVVAFLSSLVALTALALLVNTPHALAVYASRVLPSMSGAIPYLTNYSLPAATERLWVLLRSGSAAAFPDAVPRLALLLGKAASACILLVALLIIWRNLRGKALAPVVVLALFSLLAPVLSPVSWFHAYSTALIGFAWLWKRALTERTHPGFLLALTLTSLLLGTAISENLLLLLLRGGHPALASVLQFSQLLLASGLILSQLRYTSAGPAPAVVQAGA